METPAFSASNKCPFGERPIDTKTLSKVSASGASLPSKLTLIPFLIAVILVTLVFRKMFE